jgi:hypothetical protein
MVLGVQKYKLILYISAHHKQGHHGVGPSRPCKHQRRNTHINKVQLAAGRRQLIHSGIDRRDGSLPRHVVDPNLRQWARLGPLAFKHIRKKRGLRPLKT